MQFRLSDFLRFLVCYFLHQILSESVKKPFVAIFLGFNCILTRLPPLCNMTNAWINYTTFYYFLPTSLSTASFFTFMFFSWLTPGWPLPPWHSTPLLHDQCMDKLYHILLLLTNVILIHCLLLLFCALLMADPWFTFAPWPSNPLLHGQCMDKLYHILHSPTCYQLPNPLPPSSLSSSSQGCPWLTFAPDFPPLCYMTNAWIYCTTFYYMYFLPTSFFAFKFF